MPKNTPQTNLPRSTPRAGDGAGGAVTGDSTRCRRARPQVLAREQVRA